MRTRLAIARPYYPGGPVVSDTEFVSDTFSDLPAATRKDVRHQTPVSDTSLGSRTLAVDGDDQRNDQDRDDVRDLDHRVDRGARGVLVRIADGVAGDRRGMRLRP